MPVECSPRSPSDGKDPLRSAALALLCAGGVFAIVVVGLLSLMRLALPTSSAPDWKERGVRLGLSEDEVKRSFVDADAGDWTSVTSCRGHSLEWTRRRPGVPTRWARFELHGGWLVALRVHTDERLPAPRAQRTAAAVRQDKPFEDGTATTIVALGCPTHAAEAEQIAQLVK